jgi:hypothetical protein
VPPELAWRVAELTSHRARRDLARSLSGIVGELDPKWLPGVSPLNRVGLRAHVTSLLALADRLDDDRPVTAAGVLLVRDLLTDGGSPLYAAGHIEDLEPTLAQLHDLLDGR